MVDDEDKKDGLPIVTIIVAICLMLVPFTVLTYMDYMQDEYEIDRLRKEIKNKEDVSSDYIQGWNDCIAKLISIRQEATNVTSNVMNNTV